MQKNTPPRFGWVSGYSNSAFLYCNPFRHILFKQPCPEFLCPEYKYTIGVNWSIGNWGLTKLSVLIYVKNVPETGVIITNRQIRKILRCLLKN